VTALTPTTTKTATPERERAASTFTSTHSPTSPVHMSMGGFGGNSGFGARGGAGSHGGGPQGAGPLGMGRPGGAGFGGGVPRAAAPASGTAAGTTTTLTKVDERTFEAEVLRSELPVLIAFTSDRLNANSQFIKEIEGCAADLVEKAKVVLVDAAKSPFLVKQLRVQSLPTFAVFAQGRIADMQVGVLSKKVLLGMLDPFLPRAAGAMKAQEVAQLIKQGAVVPVDTRDAGAFGRAHLPGAVHMPIEQLADRVAELYMLAGPAVIYCRAGDKSREVAAQLIEQGVELGFLEGGLLAWESESLPIERS
jgi:rhodanese-related sulfurtransferase